MATKSNERTKNWAFVAYPESLPDHWEDKLNALHVGWFCSPLHDADQNADESEKKQHYHIILSYDTLKSYDQVVVISVGLLHATVPQIVKNMRGYLRYFVHLDNPEKHQYNLADIRCFGGVSLDTYLSPTSSDKDKIIDAILDFIELNDITEYCDLIMYARHNEPDWRSVLYQSSTIFFSAYLQSRRYKKSLAEARPDSVSEPSN